jgi:glucose/arabinose dehydrogenase
VSTNERDGLGDNLVPDYVTRVKEGGFYGWPWYYMGNFEDPRLAGARPDLAGKATVPDVLEQAHSASLQMTFTRPATVQQLSLLSIMATRLRHCMDHGTARPAPDTRLSESL